jgi:hypothetical protein
MFQLTIRQWLQNVADVYHLLSDEQQSTFFRLCQGDSGSFQSELNFNLLLSITFDLFSVSSEDKSLTKESFARSCSKATDTITVLFICLPCLSLKYIILIFLTLFLRVNGASPRQAPAGPTKQQSTMKRLFSRKSLSTSEEDSKKEELSARKESIAFVLNVRVSRGSLEAGHQTYEVNHELHIQASHSHQ